jgi:ABC-2 type transport system ATP-binding protein
MELKIERLSKTYANGVHALRDVSLTIPRGMFGLLGPNGAGKSTLMRILATLQEPDSGSVTLGGVDVLRDKERVRGMLGYLPQEFGLYPKVEAADLLEHFALLKGVGDRRERRQVAEALLRQTNLWSARNKRLGGFSGGMRQRFGIAVALIGNPRLIVVDEPTAGLDPAERVRFLNLLSEIGENAVVILSTHIVEDVSELCSRMAIINHGHILLEGEPLATIERLRGRVWRRVVSREELAAVEAAHTVISTKLLSGRTVVHVVADERPDATFHAVEPDLEDVYFSVMHAIPLDAPPAAPVDLSVATSSQTTDPTTHDGSAEPVAAAAEAVPEDDAFASPDAHLASAAASDPAEVLRTRPSEPTTDPPSAPVTTEQEAPAPAAPRTDAPPTPDDSTEYAEVLFDHVTLPLFPEYAADDAANAGDGAAQSVDAEESADPAAGGVEPTDQLGLFADLAPDAGGAR